VSRKVTSCVTSASSLVAALGLSCSSPSNSRSSAPPGFGEMPSTTNGTTGSMVGEDGAEPSADGSGLPPGGMGEAPSNPSSEVLMPMDVTAPGTAPVTAPPAPTRLCTSKFRVQAPLIADFEGYDGTIEANQYTFYFGSTAPNAGVIAGLFAFDDMTGTNVSLGILAGRSGRWGASHRIVQASAWGGGMGIWFDCVDASAFAGISFWVRGATATGTFSLSMAFRPTTPPDGGGTCMGAAEQCLNPALDAIPLSLDWTLIELPWTSLVPGLAVGAAFAPTGDELTGLTFGLPIAWAPDPAFVDNPNDTTDMPTFLPQPSDIIFQVDDVAFLP
jgi:hypothetical protein